MGADFSVHEPRKHLCLVLIDPVIAEPQCNLLTIVSTMYSKFGLGNGVSSSFS